MVECHQRRRATFLVVVVWYSCLMTIFFLSPSTSAFVPLSSTRRILKYKYPPSALLQAVEPSQEDVAAATKSSSSSSSSVLQNEDNEEDDSPDMKAYAAAYKTVFEEMPCKECNKPSEIIQGRVPDDLVGTYFRVGPAMFSAGSIVPPKRSILQPKQPPVPDGQDRDRMVRHPFEGDGAILGVTFGSSSTADDNNMNDDTDDDDEEVKSSSSSKDDKTAARDVTARYRFIRTTGFTNERKKGQKIYKAMEATRSMSSTTSTNSNNNNNKLVNDWHLPLYRHHLQPGLNKNRKNTSNTRAVYWGKRLLTLWEGGLPYKLDAIALSTEGRSQLGGAIETEEDAFGGKMVVDASRKRALFYGVSWPSPKKSQIVLYEFNDQFRLVDNGRTEFDIPGFALLNDFTATSDYAIFVQPNVVVSDGLQYLVSKDPAKVLKMEDATSVMHLIPRVDSSISNKRQIMTIPIPSDNDGGMDGNLQFINSYQEGDSTIVVDAIRSSPTLDDTWKKQQPLSSWPWVDSLESYQAGTSPKSPWRYTVDIRSGAISKKPLLSSQHQSCSFGVINPSRSTLPHRYIYMNVGRLHDQVSPPQGIARLDCETGQMETWMPQRHEFCGEPMFAPSSNSNDDAEADETAGYILSVLWNGQDEQSQLVILQAKDIGAGPVARIPLGMAIPHGLFGCFTASPEATWSLDAIDRRAKLDDKMESRGDMWNEVKSDFSGLGLRFDDMPEYFGDFFE